TNIGFGGWNDQVVRVVLTINDGNPTMKLGFGCLLDQGIDDESYGIDNIIIRYNDPSICTATATLPTPSLTNFCTGDVLSNNAPSSFPVGTTVVTWTVTSFGGATATCNTNVIVTEITAPSITCPGNQPASANGSCQYVIGNYTSLGSPVDNCTPTGSIVVTQSPAAGTVVSGNTTITLTATDSSGNTGTCTFTAVPTDNTAPTITCPANITTTVAAGTCAQTVTYTTPSATDNCSGCAPVSLTGYTLIGEFGGHRYFRSTGTGSWTAANTAANATGGHLATITSAGENTFLTGLGSNLWIGLSDVTTEGTYVWVTGEAFGYTNWEGGQPNNGGGGGGSDYTRINNAGQWDDRQNSDNYAHILEFECLANPITITRTAGPASGSSFPVGVTTVTHSATDVSGNISTCNFTVTVNDNINPTITCPANITANVAAGTCTYTATPTVPTYADNCSVTTLTYTLTGATT
ncbi:MAG: HYR domain-containing protein, partial [Flavobacteriales bacterium]